VLNRAMLLGDGKVVEIEIRGQQAGAKTDPLHDLPPFEGTPPSLQEVEDQHILRVLLWTEGNKRKAAQVLGIGEKTLYDKLGRMLKREDG